MKRRDVPPDDSLVMNGGLKDLPHKKEVCLTSTIRGGTRRLALPLSENGMRGKERCASLNESIITNREPGVGSLLQITIW